MNNICTDCQQEQEENRMYSDPRLTMCEEMEICMGLEYICDHCNQEHRSCKCMSTRSYIEQIKHD